MSKSPVARVFFGTRLPGCLHDSQSGAYAFARRRDLIAAVRDELAGAGLPAYLARQVRWRRLWAQVRRSGASSVHVALQGRRSPAVFEICGLTEGEYAERCADEDC